MDFAIIDIPEAFHSSDTGGLMDRCISCDMKVLEGEVPYAIEKAYKKYPALDLESVLFEYAICVNCAEQMQSELSEESKKKMSMHFREASATFFSKRSDNFPEEGEEIDIDKWISTCIVTGKHRDELTEYRIVGHCDGDQMMVSQTPFMISSEAMEGMSDLLSQKSRDELDGFIDKHFGGPPEFREILKEKDGVLI